MYIHYKNLNFEIMLKEAAGTLPHSLKLMFISCNITLFIFSKDYKSYFNRMFFTTVNWKYFPQAPLYFHGFSIIVYLFIIDCSICQNPFEKNNSKHIK